MKTQISVGAIAVLMCAGCQTIPASNLTLNEARDAYQTAQADARVQQYAPIELDRARQTLQHAEAEWNQHGNSELATHLAYLAQQRALTATELGVRGQAHARIKAASVQREQLLAQARSQELQSARARASSATALVVSLEQALADMQTQQTERGLVVTLPDVVFDTNSDQLRPGATRHLDRLAVVLRDHPDRRVLVEGFTDSKGSDSYNLDLSTRRAATVRQALVARGVSPDRIIVQGHGEAYPVATNSTMAGRQLNRRVEILFSDAQGHVAGRPMSGTYGSQPRPALR